MLGSDGSAKEGVIALQEAMERLTTLLSAEEEEVEVVEEVEEVVEVEGDGDNEHPAILQLGRVLDLYALGECLLFSYIIK